MWAKKHSTWFHCEVTTSKIVKPKKEKEKKEKKKRKVENLWDPSIKVRRLHHASDTNDSVGNGAITFPTRGTAGLQEEKE